MRVPATLGAIIVTAVVAALAIELASSSSRSQLGSLVSEIAGDTEGGAVTVDEDLPVDCIDPAHQPIQGPAFPPPAFTPAPPTGDAIQPNLPDCALDLPLEEAPPPLTINGKAIALPLGASLSTGEGIGLPCGLPQPQYEGFCEALFSSQLVASGSWRVTLNNSFVTFDDNGVLESDYVEPADAAALAPLTAALVMRVNGKDLPVPAGASVLTARRETGSPQYFKVVVVGASQLAFGTLGSVDENSIDATKSYVKFMPSGLLLEDGVKPADAALLEPLLAELTQP